MVLSKGKKIILIAVAIVIVLVGGFFAYKSYSETQYAINRAVNSVLDEDSAFSFADPYDTETVDTFIEDYWNPVKDKSSFQKKLVNRLNEEIIEPSLQNHNEDRSDKEEHEYIENQYGDTPTSAHETFLMLLSFLNQVDYQDTALKDSFSGYYKRLAETERTVVPDDAGQSEQEQELSVANDLTYTLEQVDEFNQAAGEFYQIPADEIATADEISQHYTQAIQMSYDAGDRNTYVNALSSASSSPVTEEQDFVDSDQIVDVLMEDGGQLYTLRNGVGGYYDTHSIDESGQITYYGDFATRTTISGGNKYDTSGLAGVWDSLTPGQRNEITSGNQTHTNYYYYFLGEDYDGEISPSLGDDGYGYVYMNQDGSILYFRSSSIAYVSNADFGESVIYGDFADICSELAETYETRAQAAQPKLTSVNNEQYAPYTGIFGYDGNPCFQSEFLTDGTNVYWSCTPVDGISAEEIDSFFKVSMIYGHTYNLFDLFRSPVIVQDMTVSDIRTIDEVEATTVVSFAGNRISYNVSYSAGGGTSGGYAKIR